MDLILISMVSGGVINIVTRLSGKLGISKTYVSVGLSIILGIVMYFGQILINKYPMEREQVVGFMGGSYACSQYFRNIFNKITEDEQK